MEWFMFMLTFGLSFEIVVSRTNHIIDNVDFYANKSYTFTADGKCETLVTWDYRESPQKMPTVLVNNFTVSAFKRSRVLADVNNTTNPTLNIRYAKYSDQGIYRCWCWRRAYKPIRLKEVWLGQVNSSTRKINWKKQPYAEILTDSPDKLPIHSNVVYKCAETHSVNAVIGSVRWKVNVTNDRFKVNEDAMEIRGIQPTDNGTEILCEFDAISFKKSSTVPYAMTPKAHKILVVTSAELLSTKAILLTSSTGTTLIMNRTTKKTNHWYNGLPKWVMIYSTVSIVFCVCIGICIAVCIRKKQKKKRWINNTNCKKSRGRFTSKPPSSTSCKPNRNRSRHRLSLRRLRQYFSVLGTGHVYEHGIPIQLPDTPCVHRNNSHMPTQQQTSLLDELYVNTMGRKKGKQDRKRKFILQTSTRKIYTRKMQKIETQLQQHSVEEEPRERQRKDTHLQQLSTKEREKQPNVTRNLKQTATKEREGKIKNYTIDNMDMPPQQYTREKLEGKQQNDTTRDTHQHHTKDYQRKAYNHTRETCSRQTGKWPTTAHKIGLQHGHTATTGHEDAITLMTNMRHTSERQQRPTREMLTEEHMSRPKIQERRRSRATRVTKEPWVIYRKPESNIYMNVNQK